MEQLDKKKINLLIKKLNFFYKKKLNAKNILSLIKKINPSEIYFLIGQPNSLISFEFPSKTIEINFIYLSYVVNACLNLKINLCFLC